MSLKVWFEEMMTSVISTVSAQIPHPSKDFLKFLVTVSLKAILFFKTSSNLVLEI